MNLQNPDSLRSADQNLTSLESRIVGSVQQLVSQQNENMMGSAQASDPGSVMWAAKAEPDIPFTVYYDYTGECLKMMVPSGSLVVNGKSVSLSEPDSVSEGTYYLHVKKNGESAEIDTEPTKQGFYWNIAIAKIARENVGGKFVKEQYVIGTLTIGGGGGSGDILEPVTDDRTGQITGVKNPYVLVGRKYISVSGTPTNGTNVLQIDHSGETVSASIVAGTMPPSDPTLTTTEIALYKIEDNAITEDYRNLLTVPMYDPK